MRPPGWAAGSPPLPQPIGTAGTRKYKRAGCIGVKTLIVTDISRDGTMQGPNLAMLKELSKAVNIQLIASGGIRDLHHIKQLCELGIYGAITGKALYANTLSLKEAIEESEG